MRSKIQLGVGLVSFATAALCGLVLNQRMAAEQLWGYFPLGVLLGGWFTIVAFRQNRNRLAILGISSLAGVLLALGFLPLPLWPLQMLGFATLLFLTDHLFKAGLSRKQQWWYAYHAFVLYNIGASWWVANTALAAGIVANFLNALFMAIPWVLTFMMRKHLPKVWIAASIVLWIGFEYVHYNWEIAWPWLTFGNALASTPTFAQWYSYTGVFGGSLYISLTGALVYKTITLFRAKEAFAKTGISTLVVFVVPLLMSWFMIPDVEQLIDGTQVARVAAVQPNYEPHYSKFRVSANEQLVEHFRLIEQTNDVDLIVLPETSFGRSYDEAGLGESDLGNMWASFRESRGGNVDLLTGLTTYRRYNQPTDDPALRTQQNGRRTTYYTMHNSGVAFSDKGIDIYHKSKLVPGVEFLPYRKLLFFFQPLVKKLGGTTVGLGVSDSAHVFRFGSGIFAAPLICYESIYGDYVREYVSQGANLLFVPTNDGWWDNTAGHIQHLQLAQLRAIETRRYVVQAANSGISAFIDPAGAVYDKTKYNESAVLSDSVHLLEGSTFYVLYGDQIGRLALGLAALVLLSLISKIAKKRAS